MTLHLDLIAVRNKLKKPPTLPHQVATLGYEVWGLFKTLDAAETNEVVREFQEYLTRHGFADVVDHQIDYADRLVQTDRDLAYEEVHKLFSLCDEIECLRVLGCNYDRGKHTRFETRLRAWFTNNSKVVRLVAQESLEESKKAWWWYKVHSSKSG